MKKRKILKILLSIFVISVILVLTVFPCFAVNTDSYYADIVFSPYALSALIGFQTNYDGVDSLYYYSDNMPSGIGVSTSSTSTDIHVFDANEAMVGSYTRNYNYSFKDSNAYVYGYYNIDFNHTWSYATPYLRSFAFSYAQALRKNYLSGYTINITFNSAEDYSAFKDSFYQYAFISTYVLTGDEGEGAYFKRVYLDCRDYMQFFEFSDEYSECILRPFSAVSLFIEQQGINGFYFDDYLILSQFEFGTSVTPVKSIYYRFTNFSGADKTVENLNNSLSNIQSVFDKNVVEPVYIGDYDLGGWLSNSVGSFFSADLFGNPNITLGGIFLIIIAVACTIFFLKLFSGG